MKKLIAFFFFFLLTAATFPQQVSNWENYSDMKNVTSVIPVSYGIWAASEGGGFLYNPADDSYLKINKTDGLSGLTLTSITSDKNGNIWFGGAKGSIDIYDNNNKSVRSVLDIYNSDRTSKRINELRSSGDTVFVSTDFGISLININNYEFYDTYFRFGSFPSNIKVLTSLKAGLMYVGTEQGLAVQKEGAVNLSAPESWNIYNNQNGLPSEQVNKLIEFQNSVIVGTSAGVYKFNNGTFENLVPSLSDAYIKDFFVLDNSLLILASNSIYRFESGNLTQLYTASNTLNGVSFLNDLGVLAAGTAGIVAIDNPGQSIVPNGPAANQFPGLSVDNDGILWSASGSDATGKGFYKLEDGIWTNINKGNTPILPTNAYHTVYAAPDNTVYFGNWGSGFAKIKDGDIQVFTAANTDIEGIDVNPDFIVITNFGYDSRDNLWVLNWGAVNRKPLSMLTPDSTWYHFSTDAENTYLTKHFALAIDQYDTKWYSSTDPQKAGLFYFNEKKTYNNTGDDVSGYLNQSSGLNSNDVNAIVVDNRGDVWVGTSHGVNIISDNATVLSSTPELHIISVFSLRQQTINCIAVDPVNNKWIGTNQGLLLVNSDGTSLLASFNSENSPLLSDEIKSIAIDKETGTVYAGTEGGLTSFTTPFKQPQESFTKLFVYPSPFTPGSGNSQLIIDGLIKDSELKILTVSGKLVNEIESPGGRVAFWDGRDFDGNIVSSGVYIIVAFDKEGDNLATAKVAVLRR